MDIVTFIMVLIEGLHDDARSDLMDRLSEDESIVEALAEYKSVHDEVCELYNYKDKLDDN